MVTRILNCLPSRGIEDDWGLSNAVAASVVRRQAPLPDSVDLRAPWWSVGDQGSTGSCVGWAAADSVFRWHFVQTGRLRREDGLSVRYVWLAAKEIDEFTSRPTTFIESDGTSLKAALDVARKYGLVKETVLPFSQRKMYRGDTFTFYVLAAQMRIGAYFNLGRNPHDWRTWLAEQGPILARLDVDRSWDGIGRDGLLDAYHPETASGGHAIALVGYQADRFIVRNSWGRRWGHEGFAYASDSYAGAAFSEAYGITL